MTLVSVIIPSYNHDKYLGQAISSALEQSHRQLEVVVVDDGSTDETRSVVETFGDAVAYVYQQNQGLSAARNTGLSLARGEYVAFLDADDAWEPDFLAVSLSTLEQDDRLSMSYTRFRLMDERGNRLPKTGAQPLSGDAYRHELRRNGFFTPNSAVVRRQTVDAVGRFDTDLTSLEDWDLWLRIAADYEVIGLEPALALYRICGNSMSTNAERMHANRLAVLAKHYGPPEGEPSGWSEAKREAHGCGYRSCAYEFLLQGDHDRAWALLEKGAVMWPSVLLEVSTYVEFLCGEQPRPERYEASLLNLSVRGADVRNRLEFLFAAQDNPVLASFKREALGCASVALALLCENALDWEGARRSLRSAARNDPSLLTDPAYIRRLVRLHSGKRVQEAWRRYREA